MQNKNPVKQGHEINILFYRVLFTGSILLGNQGFFVFKEDTKYRETDL